MAAEKLHRLSSGSNIAQNPLHLLSNAPHAWSSRHSVSSVSVRCQGSSPAPTLELSRKEAHHARKKEQWKLARRLRKRAEVKKAIRAQLQKIHAELKYKLTPQKTNELKGRIRALLKQISGAGLQGSFEGLDDIDLSTVGQGRKLVVKDVWLERRRTGNCDVWVRTDREMGLGLTREEKGLGECRDTPAKIGLHLGRGGGVFAKMVVPGRRELLSPIVDYEPLFQRVREPVDEMAQVHWLAHSLNAAELWIRPLHLSRLMHSARIKFTDEMLLQLVQILGDLGNWRRAMQVVDWVYARQHSRYSKSRHVLTTLLAVLGRARRPSEAARVFNVMLESPSAYPDMAAYHSFAVTLGQSGCLNELLTLISNLRKDAHPKILKFQDLHQEGRLQPDVVIYNAVLNACVAQGQWRGARWVFSQMNKENVQPTSATFGLAIEMLVKAGKVDLALRYYNRMEGGGFHANFLTIKALVLACGLSGDPDVAVELVEDMRSRGMVAGASVYYTLGCTLCKSGRWREAIAQMENIKDLASRKSDVITFTGLIQACEEAGLWQDAVEVFNHMRTICAPNIGTFNIMIGVYGKNKLFSTAMSLYEGIVKGVFSRSKLYKREPKLSADEFTYEAILGACVRSEQWEDFENVYRTARLHGFQLNSRRHTWMVTALSRGGKVDLVNRILTHLEESEQLPSVQMYQQQAAALWRVGSFKSVLLLLRQISAQGVPWNKLEWNVVLDSPNEPITAGHVEEFVSKLGDASVARDQLLLDDVTSFLFSLISGQNCEEQSTQLDGFNGANGASSAGLLEEVKASLWCDELDLFKLNPERSPPEEFVDCNFVFDEALAAINRGSFYFVTSMNNKLDYVQVSLKMLEDDMKEFRNEMNDDIKALGEMIADIRKYLERCRRWF